MGDKVFRRTLLLYRFLAFGSGLFIVLSTWTLFYVGWVRLASSLAGLGFILCYASLFGNLLASGNAAG